jgi:hypothetical protein
MPVNLDQLVLAPNFAVWSEAAQGNPTPSYTPASGGAAVAIDGIFRLPTEDVLALNDVAGISTRKPMLDIRASQVPSGVTIEQFGTVTVRGVSYTIADIRPDGDGLISLTLTASS